MVTWRVLPRCPDLDITVNAGCSSRNPLTLILFIALCGTSDSWVPRPACHSRVDALYVFELIASREILRCNSWGLQTIHPSRNSWNSFSSPPCAMHLCMKVFVRLCHSMFCILSAKSLFLCIYEKIHFLTDWAWVGEKKLKTKLPQFFRNYSKISRWN